MSYMEVVILWEYPFDNCTRHVSKQKRSITDRTMHVSGNIPSLCAQCM